MGVATLAIAMQLQNMEAELNQAKGQLDKNSKECKRQLEEERRLRNKEVPLFVSLTFHLSPLARYPSCSCSMSKRRQNWQGINSGN